MTDEERRLGLDPSKYTKKPFNPQDSFGFSKGESSIPLFKVVDDMRQRPVFDEQAEAMGQMMPTPDITSSEMEDQKRRMYERLAGESGTALTQGEMQSADRAYFARPESQELIRQLNLDFDLERGTPILQEDDEKRLHHGGDRRAELLKQLMESR